MPIRTLIVDDEPLARQRIASLLEKERDIAIIGEYGDGKTAATAIKSNLPELVFLDVQLPEMDGFQIVESLPTGSQPAIIFVTAYDQYALRAFRVHAVDYLLKPVESHQLAEALDHVRQRLRFKDESRPNRLLDLLEDIKALRSRGDCIVLNSGKEILCFKPEEIDWIEAAGNYVCLHVGPSSHLLREKMIDVEQKLHQHNFVRIHRSRIVNFAHVKRLKPLLYGDYTVEMRDGTRLTMSRLYRDTVLKRLGAE